MPWTMVRQSACRAAAVGLAAAKPVAAGRAGAAAAGGLSAGAKSWKTCGTGLTSCRSLLQTKGLATTCMLVL